MFTTNHGLQSAVDRARAAGAVGIDTEFVWNRTYYPTLGVVQIGYPDQTAELIDAPEIEDWSAFGELMADAGTVKILHDAVQDLVILHRVSGTFPRNIFDTQRASGFVGLSSTISLSELLKTLLKVRLAKTETQSDWLARPLSESQLKYAADDVNHSTELMVKIMERAEKLGRRDWIEDEMRSYEDESLYAERDPDLEMPRVRKSGSLTHQQREMLRALGSWRELKARRRNMPRNFVLSDDAIISLVKKPPQTAEDIRPCKGLSEKSLQHNRKGIWEAIERGRDGGMPELVTQRMPGGAPDDGYEARVDLALAFVKGTCMAADLDPALIGNRAEITALVLDAEEADPERHAILRGWRAECCGRDLLGLLRGEGAVTVDAESGLPRLA